MDPSRNPFHPGAGLRPPALVGRDTELDAFDTTLIRTSRTQPNRGLMLSGLRGVGKTVLLNELRTKAERADWLVVALEGQRTDHADKEIRHRLARELLAAGRRFNKQGISGRLKTALGSITSFGASAGVTGISLNVDVSPGRADSGELETDLGELVEDFTEALTEQGSAFALFIDEMQDLSQDTLSALLAIQHRAGQRSQPFYLIGAGLPSLPTALSEARSYAERLFDYRVIGPLTEDASRNALLNPARDSGADIEPDALQLLVNTTQGYPYFLQEYGQAIWNLSPTTPFNRSDAETAIAYGRSQLDAGFFTARWGRATKAERRFLRAMAEDADQHSRTADIVQRLGVKEPSGIGPARAQLIYKGLVYAPEHGLVAYTAPGMSDFILRQDGE